MRFENFELDIRTGELRKDGTNVVRLSEQPLRIMIALLERPGELVLREDLRKRLWPNDTVVEFEHSINAAIKRLRQTLGDSAEAPRFIATLARRGYRWKTPVEWVGATTKDREPPAASAQQNLIGKRVSHYRVLEVLGGGGMGLVYKAEDIKLGRRVALKFLPEELATDLNSLERFRREARAASAADHPNICTIYEVGEHKGAPFIAMQLLHGQTLRERIEKSTAVPILLEELLVIAIQVADGLDAAHRAGVIHRDINPANIFVTNQGQTKILDFGLAKLSMTGTVTINESERDPNDSDLAHGVLGETVGRGRTVAFHSQTGVAMGTAGYMSPEQVRGEELDARTDLFSFGLVLYEMVTGKRAFVGDSATEVHEVMLHEAPAPIAALRPDAPLQLEVIIAKALEKDRRARYQSSAEIRADLETLKRPAISRRRQRLGWTIVVASLLFVFGAGAFRLKTHRSSPPAMVQRQLTVNSSENPTTGGAISPDGKYLAYTDLSGIHIKQIETGQNQSIPQPDVFKESPPQWQSSLWWPDSTRFLLWAGAPEARPSPWKSSVWSASVLGGPPKKILDEASPWAVSPDGRLIAITKRNQHEIWLTDSNGENAQKIAERDDADFRSVQWSPDGKHLAYLVTIDISGSTAEQIESLDVQSGHVAQMFKLRGVAQLPIEFQDFTWIPDGRVIYVGGEPDIHGYSCNLWQAYVDNRTASLIRGPELLTNWAGFCLAGLSHTTDGKKMAFTRSTDLMTVYVARFDAKKLRVETPRRLTLTDDMSSPAGWTPDGKAILIRSNREGSWGLYRQDLNREIVEPIVTGLKTMSWYASYSPDRKWLIYDVRETSNVSGPLHVMRRSVAGGAPQEVTRGDLLGTRCPTVANGRCVIAELNPGRAEIVFFALDLNLGKQEELARFRSEHADQFAWELSPNGKRIVLFKEYERQFHLITLAHDAAQAKIRVKSGAQLRTLSWAADGEGLFASGAVQQGAELLYIDLRGNARSLWRLRGRDTFLWGRPSPDGSYLAILGSAGSANVWVMEDF